MESMMGLALLWTVRVAGSRQSLPPCIVVWTGVKVTSFEDGSASEVSYGTIMLSSARLGSEYVLIDHCARGKFSLHDQISLDYR
jgi:hypothetical protein